MANPVTCLFSLVYLFEALNGALDVQFYQGNINCLHLIKDTDSM